MALTAKVSGGGSNFEEAPQGTHIARCTRVLDLGTQEKKYGDDVKLQHQVWIMWELPMIHREWEDKDGVAQEGPGAISQFYNLSMNERANLRKMLESWRSKTFTNEEAEAFDIGSILDKPCLLSIVHATRKDGGTRADVSGVMALPKGMECPPRQGDLVYLELTKEGFRPEVFESLSDRMQERIKQSPEYLLAAGKMAHMEKAAESQQPSIPYEDTPNDVYDEDDEVPF